MIWAFFIPIFIVGLAIALATHRKSIEDQAYLDKGVVLRKYLAYAKLNFDYRFNKGDRIVCYDEVEEAKSRLVQAYLWFNKKYKKYGIYLPPELFEFEEE